MNQYRINRLFDERSGRCLDLAIDYGVFGETRYLQGLQDMAMAVDMLAPPGPDAMQLTVGQAHLLQSRPGRYKPSLILRLDVTNVFAEELPDDLFNLMVEDGVEQALRLDAACVAVNLFDVPGQPELRRECTANILDLQPRCAAVGMPLMVEPLVMRWGHEQAGYAVDGDPDRIAALVRQSVELGADLVQADVTVDVADFAQVVAAAGGAPVLVRAGGMLEDTDILARTRLVLDQGARGVVFGQNIVQHDAPVAFLEALLAIVHEHRTAEEGAALLAGGRVAGTPA